jgi:hypothetical protein
VDGADEVGYVESFRSDVSDGCLAVRFEVSTSGLV